ncbi:MAG: hypothetical protein ACJ71Q_05295 [Terriglobales bacterium]|jgi:hypothetical protein
MGTLLRKRGASAGVLVGLQVVVLTLIARKPVVAGQAHAGTSFASPTVVHFGAVLLLSGIVSAPWQAIVDAATLWGLLGLCGMVYAIIVVRRIRAQSIYTPQAEDWLFHVLLPFAAYATLAGSAVVEVYSKRYSSLFAVGAAALLLLIIGIHNAWDTMTYHIYFNNEDQKTEKEEG